MLTVIIFYQGVLRKQSAFRTRPITHVSEGVDFCCCFCCHGILHQSYSSAYGTVVFRSNKGGGFWEQWPPWLRPSSCCDHWLQGHMAAGMLQKLMRVSLKSTVFPASPQSFWEADSLFIHCFFFLRGARAKKILIRLHAQCVSLTWGSISQPWDHDLSQNQESDV